MRLTDYEYCNKLVKKEWLDSIEMKVGLRYFGGKTMIGRYIFNNIFNLSVIMKKKGKRPDILIDAFAGGGKIGLSIPYGWYDTIVMNDINYGVYSYYKYCQDDYIALIFMIEKIGEFMSRKTFNIAKYIRNFNLGVQKWKDDNDKEEKDKDRVKEDEVLDPLVAAALTYWVTATSFNGMTDTEKAKYNLIRIDDEYDSEKKKLEQQKIKQIISRAYKRIPQLHEKLNRQHYIIENLDYRELIKKYNGLKYTDLQGKEHEAIEVYSKRNKLWYFDPPYHPLCLYGGKEAGYADTFTEELANEMVEILSGKKNEAYGELEYFIKSDYDPKETLEIAKRELGIKDINKDEEAVDKKDVNKDEEAVDKKDVNKDKKEVGKEDVNKNEEELGKKKINKSLKEWYQDIIAREKKNNEISNLFKDLEVPPFCKVCVGGFDKGTVGDMDKGKSIGYEYIWCNGFPADYVKMEGDNSEHSESV